MDNVECGDSLAVKQPTQSEIGGSNPASPLQSARQLAEQRFKTNPVMCFQRHLIEASAELNPREKYPKEFLLHEGVREITRAECATFIEQYEYLGTLGRGSVYYGLFMPNGEMVGANCICMELGIEEF